MVMKLGNIAQGHTATNIPGTNTNFFLDHEEVKKHTHWQGNHKCVHFGW